MIGGLFFIMGKVIAYLRVSTSRQDLEKNKDEILRLANEKKLGHVEFIEEKVSGSVKWKKRKIGEIIETLSEGDIIIVSELSRLGRSMLECMEILSISTDKGIKIYSVKVNWNLDNTIQSKIIAMAFSMAAEIERDLISQRTKEALRARKEAGVKLGRPKGSWSSKLNKHKKEIIKLLENGSTKRFIAKKFKTSEQNLYKWIKKHNL
jgi:DNA invertase Pin-like site-specific DNA recombinase